MAAACSSATGPDVAATNVGPQGQAEGERKAPPAPAEPRGYGPAAPMDCPDAAFPAVVEAEDARLTGVQASTAAPGFEGHGYVDGFDAPGDAVTFELCVPQKGYYTLDLRYANASHVRATRTIFIDGELLPGEHVFRSRWSPDDWGATSEEDVRDSALLEAGLHRITVTYQPNDEGPLALDRLSLSPGAAPSSTSVTSLLLNDWRGVVAGVFGSRIFVSDDTASAPRIGELRGRANWEANNVDEAAGYLRDDTSGVAYTDRERRPIDTDLFVRDDGVVEMDYRGWGTEPLPARVTKEHAAPPNGELVVVRYTIANATPERRNLSLLEHVDLNRTGAQASRDLVLPGEGPSAEGTMHVRWRPELHAFIADLGELHGTYIVFGAFQDPDEHGAAPSGGGTVSSPDGGETDVDSILSQFDDGAPLVPVESYDGDDAEMAPRQRLTLDPGQSATASYFYAVRGSMADAEKAARDARAKTAAAWFDETKRAYSDWLASREKLTGDFAPLDAPYRRALVAIKQTQQPELGSFVAATNPAYQFKVWPRDASVVAMGLDATGYLDDAEKYWRWMTSVQERGDDESFPDGTWATNYSYWKPNESIDFVQPEWDSLGLYCIGVYRHYLLVRERRGASAASDFFRAAWPAVERAARYIAGNIGDNGLGPKDFSIWEDRFEWATFTQVTYASGLTAAFELAQTAKAEGEAIDTAAVERFREAARTIKDAMLRPFDQETCTGLWEPTAGYFLRGIEPDCSTDARIDASTDLAWVFGLVDATSEQARSHRDRVLGRLSPTDYFQGISRYENDAFYYSSIYGPGGPYEARAPEPTWPQMSMYMSMAEHWLSLDALSRARLDWYASTTGTGFMPPGEAIDWSRQQPLVSTAVEPVTGSWYLLALMVHAGRFEPRLSHVGVDSGI